MLVVSGRWGYGMRALPAVLLLGSFLFVGLPGGLRTVAPPVAPAVTVNILADFNSWNFTQPSGSNPFIASARLFLGQTLQVNVKWVNAVHDFAIYVPGTPESQVDFNNNLRCSQTPGCLVESRVISSSNTLDTVTFTAASFGDYEYYCEYHPDFMHGQIRFLKSPDINGDSSVNIIDLSQIGAAFGAFPSSANWNPNADLNFDSLINIIDLVIVAANFGRTI